MTSDRNQVGAYATTSAPVAGLAMVRATLSRAQSRWRMNALLRSCILSILVGLALFCALEAAALVSDLDMISRLIPRLFSAPTLDHLAKGAVVFAGTLGLTALVAYLRAPGLATHARTADHIFGLKERLSTALEVASAGPLGTPQDPVRSALLTDAEQHARSIDVRALVPLGLPPAA